MCTCFMFGFSVVLVSPGFAFLQTTFDFIKFFLGRADLVVLCAVYFRTGHHQSAQIRPNLQHLCICICPASMSVTHF